MAAKRAKTASDDPKRDDETTISGQALAIAFEISLRRVQQFAEQGVIERAGHGHYALKGVASAIAKSQADGEVARRQPADPAAAASFETERARKLKWQNDEQEGLLIRTDAALALVDWIFGAMETALSGVPAQFTQDVGERRRLEHVMDTVREGLARDFREARRNTLASGDPLDATGADQPGRVGAP